MKDILLVFIGGGLGSALRLLLNKIIPSDAFPYSTMTVNLIGSFLIV
jgi:CrcB protein